MLHELFSRNGLTFWLVNPTNRQSSCSCSVTYLTMSAHACDTDIRWMDASRRSWSTMPRCCCKLVAIKSMTAVSDRPMVLILTRSFAYAMNVQSSTAARVAFFCVLLRLWLPQILYFYAIVSMCFDLCVVLHIENGKRLLSCVVKYLPKSFLE